MDPVYLGKGVVLDGGLGSSRPNDNQIVFGGTGSGKSYSIVLPTLAHMENSSFIATFAKRSVVDSAMAFFRKKGYRTILWNLANPGPGDAVPDPFDYMRDESDLDDLAKQIASSNPRLQHSGADPYWEESAEGLMSGCLRYVRETSVFPSMRKVIDFFYKIRLTEKGQKAIASTVDGDIERLAAKKPSSVAVRKLCAFTGLPYATGSCVRDTLDKNIQTVFPSAVQNAMKKDGYVDFRRLAAEKTALFILTSPSRPTQYAFANMMFGIAIRELTEFAESRPSGRLPLDVKLIFDDFSCGFPIRDYERTISTFRAAGISALMLCQSLSQLDATFGADKATVILDNVSSLVYMPGSMNKKTCAFISEMVNMPLDDVMFMPVGSVIIFRTGVKPTITRRYDTMSDPLCRELMSAEDSREIG